MDWACLLSSLQTESMWADEKIWQHGDMTENVTGLLWRQEMEQGRGVKVERSLHPLSSTEQVTVLFCYSTRTTFSPTWQSTCDQCCSRLPELPQGSTLFTLLDVSPQGSGGGAIVGGAPPPHGSELVGDVGDATPHGSGGAAPHGPEAAGAGTVGGGEGPAEPTVATVAAGVAPQGSTALSSIRALCTREMLWIL